MKRLLRIFGWWGCSIIAIAGFSLAYSSSKGYTTWYLRVNGRVTVDGRVTNGYLHANSQRTVLLVTRKDEDKPETYLVPVGLQTTIFDCGEWHPVRFIPTPIGDLNPPCSVFTKPAEIKDAPVQATLIRRRNSVEFSTASGKKIEAEW
jgi:hypothetical protein